MNSPVPVLEIGGTHVTAASVDVTTWDVVARTRLPLDADGPADALVRRFVTAAADLDVPAGARWGVAVPDPFDYERGIGRFEGVGKFGALNGVDLRQRLAAGLHAAPGSLRFVNDADAFVVGEWTAGAAAGAQRCAGITLGTGVGSGWLVDGRPVDPGLPPGGRIHRMRLDGRPLEDLVSRRAIRREYAARGGDPAADVREIASTARGGDPLARRVLDEAFEALGRAVAECVTRFGPDVLVVGGSMAASWELFEPPFRAGAGGSLPEVRLSADADTSALLGAAASADRWGQAGAVATAQ